MSQVISLYVMVDQTLFIEFDYRKTVLNMVMEGVPNKSIAKAMLVDRALGQWFSTREARDNLKLK